MVAVPGRPILRACPRRTTATSWKSNLPSLLGQGHPTSAPIRWATTSSPACCTAGRPSLEIAVAVNSSAPARRRHAGRARLATGAAGSIRSSCAAFLRRADRIAHRSVLALAIAQSLGPSNTNTIFALAFFSVAAFVARIARAATLQLREQTFMTAARLSGTPRGARWCGTSRRTSSPGSSRSPCSAWGSSSSSRALWGFLGLASRPPTRSLGEHDFPTAKQTLSATPRYVLLRARPVR